MGHIRRVKAETKAAARWSFKDTDGTVKCSGVNCRKDGVLWTGPGYTTPSGAELLSSTISPPMV